MQPLILVSGDTHAAPDPDLYRQYIDPKYIDEVDGLVQEGQMFGRLAEMMKPTAEVLEIIDVDGVYANGGLSGGGDFTRRLQEMDREGVAAEVVLAGVQATTLPFFATVNKPHPPELRAAGAHAYHRWIADAIQVAPKRFFPVGDAGPCFDMDETVRELEWIADHGFVGVNLPGYTGDPDLPALSDPYFSRFFATCADLNLIMIMHAGFGLPQGSYYEMFERLGPIVMNPQLTDDERMAAMFRDPFFSTLDQRYRRGLWQLLLSGAFDRHPNLKFVSTELGADWVPQVLSIMDKMYRTLDTPLSKAPSEYWQSNCAVVASSVHKSEVEIRHDIGIEQMMFGTDYPHPESTWPNTQDWIRAAFVGVPEAEARKILGENAIRFYNMDAKYLETIAASIGPDITTILSGGSVDPKRTDCFHARAAFNAPIRELDQVEITLALSPELETAGFAAGPHI